MKKATILSTLEEILEKYRYVNDSTDGGRVGAFKRFRKTLDEQGIQDLENILLSWLREASSGSRRNRLSVVFLEGECSEYGKKKLLEILKKNNWKNNGPNCFRWRNTASFKTTI